MRGVIPAFIVVHGGLDPSDLRVVPHSLPGSGGGKFSFQREVAFLSANSKAPKLPQESLDRLRDGLASWRGRKALTPEANEVVIDLCLSARQAGWTPEQLVVAVKDACYNSPELDGLASTSERDAFLARIVTACIKEYFRVG